MLTAAPVCNTLARVANMWNKLTINICFHRKTTSINTNNGTKRDGKYNERYRNILGILFHVTLKNRELKICGHESIISGSHLSFFRLLNPDLVKH